MERDWYNRSWIGDGSAVRLTIARYYTPSGRSIQKPYTEYEDDYMSRYRSGELFTRDSIHVVDSLKFTTPGGKVVYGGGGIIPDVFVGMDTLRNKEFNGFFRRNVHEKIFEYVDSNRFDLERWDLDEYMLMYTVPESVIEDYLVSNDVDDLSAEQVEMLEDYLKSLVGQQLFGDEGYYRMEARSDLMIQKVLQLESEAGKDVLPL